ncbi:hypothetical protein AB0B89_25260 [Sphaerisporangium sp. NPDC049002]|uniref:hypothetical protein n=1 Tax=unclassified Sphaerisporangium TaxID=2630420 RepID=UPI0033DC3EC2
MKAAMVAAMVLLGAAACTSPAPERTTALATPTPVRTSTSAFATTDPQAKVVRIPSVGERPWVVGTLPDGRPLVGRGRHRFQPGRVDILDPATGRSSLLVQDAPDTESFTVLAAADGSYVARLLGNDEPGGWELEVIDLRTGRARTVVDTWQESAWQCGNGWDYPRDLQLHQGLLYFSRCVTTGTGDVGVFRIDPGHGTPGLWRRGLYDLTWQSDGFLARSPVVSGDAFTGSLARFAPDGTRRGLPVLAAYLQPEDVDNLHRLEYADGTAAVLSPRAKGVSTQSHFAVWREGQAAWLLDVRTRTATRLPGRRITEAFFPSPGFLQWHADDDDHAVDLRTLH